MDWIFSCSKRPRKRTQMYLRCPHKSACSFHFFSLFWTLQLLLTSHYNSMVCFYTMILVQTDWCSLQDATVKLWNLLFLFQCLYGASWKWNFFTLFLAFFHLYYSILYLEIVLHGLSWNAKSEASSLSQISHKGRNPNICFRQRNIEISITHSFTGHWVSLCQRQFSPWSQTCCYYFILGTTSSFPFRK